MDPIGISSERISAAEYIDFLKRTDLGSQYPKERFHERIEKLVKNAGVSLVARDESGKIVGVCFCITDFAYWMFITDLGIDRDFVRLGIGRRLVETALELAGGKENIIVYTCANRNAIPFYKSLGMSRASDDVMEMNCVDWTEFTVE